MDPISALIGGGASLLGNIFSSSTSASNVDKQLAFAQEQQNWQTQMSNTAYQRASADMKAAGLNPMMMFGSGSAASTPGQISAPNFSARTSPMAGLGDAVKTGLQTAVTSKEMDKLTEQTAAIQLDNREMRRKLGLPELDIGTGQKAYGQPEADIERTKSEAALNQQRLITQKYGEDVGRFWDQQSDIVKKAIIAGDKTLDAGGRVIDLIPGKKALFGNSAKEPTGVAAPSPKSVDSLTGATSKQTATQRRKAMESIPGDTWQEMWNNRISSDKPYPY